jgi:hypothetical protein
VECNKQRNMGNCNCSYPGCSRKGACCECIRYHLAARELPACCFPKSAEKTYDRTFAAFARAWDL